MTINKLWRTSLATAIFLIILLLTYGVHARYFSVNVVLYGAIFDGLLASVLTTVLLWQTRWLKQLGKFERLQLFLIWLLMSYAFAISVPTVIDRSLSFYLLEKLQQRGGGIQLARFDEIFVREYMPEHRLMQIRLTEQIASGTVVLDNNCVRLTQRGQQIAGFSRYFRQHFLPRQRLLMGEYSDVLTDPFRHGKPSSGYEC